MGVAKWQFPYTLTAEQVSEKEAIKDAWKTRNPTPEKANKQLMDDFIGQLRTKREKYVDQTQDYCEYPIEHVKVASIPPYNNIVQAIPVLLPIDNNFPVLHILVILPPHQRQGLGSKLIAEGLRQADEANARTYIEASKKGLGLYLKFGWEPFDEIALDMTKYGYEGLEVEKILWRPKKEELGEKYRSLSSLANGG